MGPVISGDRYSPLPNAPYFNFQRRQFLIEGSYNIIPTRPIDIGGDRQLLVDKHVVDSTWNCFRTVHQPTKHPANPLIPGGELMDKGSFSRANWGTVLYDDQFDRFRLWTALWDTTRPKV